MESLLGHVTPHGSIVVYNATFEKAILKDLALFFPEYASTFEAMMIDFGISWIYSKNTIHILIFVVLIPSRMCFLFSTVLAPRKLDIHDENLDVYDENLDVRDGLEAQAVWNLMLNTTDEQRKTR